MTDLEKSKIAALRSQGYGYKKIAQELGLSLYTVKAHCKRNEPDTAAAPRDGKCLCCKQPLISVPGKKRKKFCSDRCRNKWWNAHLDQVKKKAIYEFTCANCKKPFTAYGNTERKYCCRACYIEDRFGGLSHG